MDSLDIVVVAMSLKKLLFLGMYHSTGDNVDFRAPSIH